MNDGERIQHLLNVLKARKFTLAKALGLKSDSRLRYIMEGRNNVSSNLARELVDIIEGLDYDWILTGKGTPPASLRFKRVGSIDGAPNSPTSPTTYQNEADPIADFNPKGTRYDRKNGMSFQDLEDGKILMSVPLVGQYAEAGYLSGYNDPQYLDDLEKYSVIVDRHHRGVYRAFSVRGDSMDDGTNLAIMAGDIVLGRQVESVLWNSRFHLHDWEDFIIVHREGVIVKRILKHDVEKGTILLHSLNPDKGKYPDFEMPLEDVMEVYNIIEVTRKRRR